MTRLTIYSCATSVALLVTAMRCALLRDRIRAQTDAATRRAVEHHHHVDILEAEVAGLRDELARADGEILRLMAVNGDLHDQLHGRAS